MSHWLSKLLGRNRSRHSKKSAPSPGIDSTRGGDPKSVDSPRVRVENLSGDVCEQDLKDLFKGIGDVRCVEIIYSANSNRSEGYGFVEMHCMAEAVLAVEILHDQPFMGRRMIVSGAKLKGHDERDNKEDFKQTNISPAEDVIHAALDGLSQLYIVVFQAAQAGATIPEIAKRWRISETAATNILATIRARLVRLNRIDLMPTSCSIPNPVRDPSMVRSSPHEDFNQQKQPASPLIVPAVITPPPVVVADRDGDAFHSLRVGRKTKLSFHRTLRVPEDGSDYPLPAGLGSLPIHRIEDYADTVPQKWLEEGGFFIPLYQREALFIQFEGEEWHPSIAKVCVGRINAITGQPYSEKLSSHSQDYVVIPQQKWLDGINSRYGIVKQFVAMPLGHGYTIEAQRTDEETYGGFQLLVFEPTDGRFAEPAYSIDKKVEFLRKISILNFESMLAGLNRRQRAAVDSIRDGSYAAKAAFLAGMLRHDVIALYRDFRNSFLESVASNAKRHFSNDKDFKEILIETFIVLRDLRLGELIDPEPDRSPSEQESGLENRGSFSLGSSPSQPEAKDHPGESVLGSSPSPNYAYQDVEEMGIAAGGKIKQQIFTDTYGVESWDFNQRRLLKIHMVNSIAYKLITGKNPPPSPVTVEEYQESGVPWFSHYDENTPAIKGAGAFNNIMGVGLIDKRRGVSDARALSGIQISPEIIRRVKTPDLKEAVQGFRQRSRENADAGRWEQAIREINYLLDLEYGVEAQDYALRSSCNYQIKKYLEGMFDGDMALELDSNCFEAISSRAYCRLLLGDFLGVKEDAERLLREPKTELVGLELRAEAALLSGEYSDAIADALALGTKRPGYCRAEEILSEARTKEYQQLIAIRSK